MSVWKAPDAGFQRGYFIWGLSLGLQAEAQRKGRSQTQRVWRWRPLYLPRGHLGFEKAETSLPVEIRPGALGKPRSPFLGLSKATTLSDMFLVSLLKVPHPQKPLTARQTGCGGVLVTPAWSLPSHGLEDTAAWSQATAEQASACLTERKSEAQPGMVPRPCTPSTLEGQGRRMT